ncbi:hypothetical protein LguiA_026883 [Lonicera macranthoides]
MYLPTHLYFFLLKKNPKFHKPKEALHNDILPFQIVPYNLDQDDLFQRHANRRALTIHRILNSQLYEAYELDEPLAMTCS